MPSEVKESPKPKVIEDNVADKVDNVDDSPPPIVESSADNLDNDEPKK